MYNTLNVFSFHTKNFTPAMCRGEIKGFNKVFQLHFIYVLELWTSCYELLTSFVSFVLLEVLDETVCEIFSLFFPL